MSSFPPLEATFFTRPVPHVAAGLVGCTLRLHGVGGVIVETEAYDATDPASHSVRGPTPRNRAMFGPPAHAYVYRAYGIHWCLNLVCGEQPGGAVLIRALAPAHGVERMRGRRAGLADRLLCAGPGRLCQALAITGAEDGAKLLAPPFALHHGPAVPLAVGRRIGITKGVETRWRFGWAGSPYLSRPFEPTTEHPTAAAASCVPGGA